MIMQSDHLLTPDQDFGAKSKNIIIGKFCLNCLVSSSFNNVFCVKNVKSKFQAAFGFYTNILTCQQPSDKP